MYIINPFISGLLLKMPTNILNLLAIIMLIIFAIDSIVSFSIITKIHLSTRGIVMDNTEEITKKVREYVANHSKFGNRLTKSYSHLKVLKEKYKKKRR